MRRSNRTITNSIEPTTEPRIQQPMGNDNENEESPLRCKFSDSNGDMRMDEPGRETLNSAARSLVCRSNCSERGAIRTREIEGRGRDEQVGRRCSWHGRYRGPLQPQGGRKDKVSGGAAWHKIGGVYYMRGRGGVEKISNMEAAILRRALRC